MQKALRETPGVSALVYDQTCAAEARRLRKRGEFPDPDRRVVIHEGVCEGCGDCSVQSNCISIEPVETELGRKRRINQSSCNKDYSCLKGYCPSFVSVVGGTLRKASREGAVRRRGLLRGAAAARRRPTASGRGTCSSRGSAAPASSRSARSSPWPRTSKGKGCSELDVTGLAQKNGPVSSHVRIARRPGGASTRRASRTGAAIS